MSSAPHTSTASTDEKEVLEDLALVHDIGKTAGTASSAKSVELLPTYGTFPEGFICLVKYRDVNVSWCLVGQIGQPSGAHCGSSLIASSRVAGSYDEGRRLGGRTHTVEGYSLVRAVLDHHRHPGNRQSPGLLCWKTPSPSRRKPFVKRRLAPAHPADLENGVMARSFPRLFGAFSPPVHVAQSAEALWHGRPRREPSW